MIELLQDNKERVYPAEYLVSRLRGRWTDIIKGWQAVDVRPGAYEAVIASENERYITGVSLDIVWKKALNEMKWVYFQMNAVLQNVFQPFFLYHEIGTLQLCLRYKRKGATDERVELLLSQSLLSKTVRNALLGASDIRSFIFEIERLFIPLSKKFKGVIDLFSENDTRGVEQKMIEIYLEHIVIENIHKALRLFFEYMIDMRNLMALYKHLRWRINTMPYLIAGGSVGRREIEIVFAAQEMAGIERMIRKLTGLREDLSSVESLENYLLKGLTRSLKKAGRVDQYIEYILYYLWRCHIEARNASLALYGKDLEDERMRGEMIY